MTLQQETQWVFMVSRLLLYSLCQTLKTSFFFTLRNLRYLKNGGKHLQWMKLCDEQKWSIYRISPQQQLWRAVPPCGNILSVVGICPFRQVTRKSWEEKKNLYFKNVIDLTVSLIFWCKKKTLFFHTIEINSNKETFRLEGKLMCHVDMWPDFN